MAWGVPEYIVDKSVRDLDLEVPIENAYATEGGVLVIITRNGQYEVPLYGYGKTTTLPTLPTGNRPPGSTSTGGSVPPKAPELPAGVGPEPPPEPSAGSSLDDFTAIDGVGPVTAQRLHDVGLFTYDDIRQWLKIVSNIPGISNRTVNKIKAWLDQRLDM